MSEFNSIVDMIDEVRDITERYVAGMRSVSAEKLGLDIRCGMLWVDEDAIVAYKGSRVEYYGGFEYVKDDDRAEVGDYVVYFATSSRVADAIESLMEHDGECESEEA